MAIAQHINTGLLLRARLRKGWTQLQVAQRCAELAAAAPPGRKAAVDDTAISRYERGELRPTPAKLLLLATALDITVDQLLTLGDIEDEADEESLTGSAA